MLTAERKRMILNLLKAEGQVQADKLARRFKVSEDTIRRDLRQLAKEGLLERVHGGALLRPPVCGLYAKREHQSPDAKRAIGAATAALFQRGQTVAIDAGTTPLAVAEALSNTLPLSVVTHSLPVGLALCEHPAVEVLMLGGTLFKQARACAGAETVDAYRRIHADFCVLGLAGLHPEAGATTFDPEEALVKRAMIQNAGAVVAVAAPEKLGTIAPHLLAPADRLTHLVTGPAPEEQLEPFRTLGVNVIVAGAGN
ncbi:MAG: sugar metabolism transcriptional regulator [Puniceicoccaceae bacterium 5H]|nr:MAG: sugar metabolism transcriptional regulator [Puniceicoccaceae bacterium 5H]